MTSLRPNATVGLAIGLMAIIVMMVLPMPSWVLDMGVAASFAFAILIFTMTLFIEKPLDFSSFSSVLLASLLLRLSLNVSSTKLIIGEGHTGTGAAGSIIEGFAMFVMGGNIAIGLIVFSVLVIVNFMVITKGAGRMAEVGARFALDAMPGKQMAIDSDLAAGAISHKEAGERRQREQEETAFLGSLDGVSKFMKGDAVAGILITLLNLFAGMAIGVGVHGMSFADAGANYAILTVGDGLVSQIPAVIISISAGLLLSRGRGDGAVDLALFDQFTRHPMALAAVAGIMAVFALFPGLPVFPFMIGSLGLGYVAWRSQLKANKPAESENLLEEPVVDTEMSIADMLDVDELSVEMSRDLVGAVMGTKFGFDQRVKKIRHYVAQEYGFILPPIRLTDAAELPRNSYRMRLHGAILSTHILMQDHRLALIEAGEHTHIPGDATREPVFDAPARWIAPEHENELMLSGVTTVAPVELLETIAEGHANKMNAEMISDVARQRLSRQFISKLRNETGQLPLVRLGENWTSMLSERESKDASGRSDIVLAPDEFNKLAQDVRVQLDNAARQGSSAVIATPAVWRRFVRFTCPAFGRCISCVSPIPRNGTSTE